MDREAERRIEWDCQQLLVRFYNAFDEWRYEEMGDLLAPDGVWHRQGKALRGREQVLAELNLRPRTQTIRHVVTNILITVTGEKAADATLYITAYRHDSAEKPTGVPVIRSPALLIVATAKLVQIADSWRIAEQTMKREFEFKDPV